MNKDIEPIITGDLRSDSINISDISKYDKFINFVSMPPEYDGMVLFPKKRPFMFHTDEMLKEKFKANDGFSAMCNLERNIKRCIESDLKNNYELQDKINTINIKAKQKIEKLTEKATKKMKLKEKFRMDLVEKYFESKQESEEESLASSKEPPSSP